MKLNKHKSH